MSEFQPTNQPTNQPVSLSELPRWQGGFPGEHEYSTLEELDNPDGRFDEALLAAEALTHRWNGGKFVGLWLYGTPGTGKTHFAVGLGRALHEVGADIAYQSIPNHLSQYQPYNGTGKTQVEMAEYPGFYAGSPVFTNGLRGVDSIFSTGHLLHKPVLLLDDYKPAARKQVAAAVEAGAEAGGLVVVTSNYPDPFKLFDAKTRVHSEQEILMRDMAERADGDALEALDKSREDEEQEFSASLRSRIAAGFKFLEFTGDDQRVARSFWG
ncbi:MAG: hypothetical protein WBP23_01410 [Candidatus Saccharimonadales bacterium]